MEERAASSLRKSSDMVEGVGAGGGVEGLFSGRSHPVEYCSWCSRWFEQKWVWWIAWRRSSGGVVN